MSNAFAQNRSYLCAERASHFSVKTYWLPVDVCGGGSLFDELGCLGHRGYTLSGFCRFSDHVDHEVRLRQHRHVAALRLDGRCAHAPGEEAFQVWMNGAILACNDGPARLRLPSDAVYFLVEQVLGS